MLQYSLLNKYFQIKCIHLIQFCDFHINHFEQELNAILHWIPSLSAKVHQIARYNTQNKSIILKTRIFFCIPHRVINIIIEIEHSKTSMFCLRLLNKNIIFLSGLHTCTSIIQRFQEINNNTSTKKTWMSLYCIWNSSTEKQGNQIISQKLQSQVNRRVVK